MNRALFLIIFSSLLFAQENVAAKTSQISFFSDILGRKGVMAAVGLIFFLYSYRNSIKFFDWIEDQTYGTRDYIMQRLELLHIDIESRYITYALLIISFGFGIFIFGVFSLFAKFTMGAIFGLIITIVGWKIPRPLMDYLVERRIKAYSIQMVDGLNLLSNGLRAGLSLPQAIGMVVDELPSPISQEFNVILQQSKIGVPLEEAFENLVKRIPTEDNEMFVSSVNILRETGGNLAEVFDTITAVIRERVRLTQKIETYIAQGKFQGYTIFAMPFALGGMFSISDPASMAPLFNTVIGNILLLVALGLNFTGLFVILKIVKIKV